MIHLTVTSATWLPIVLIVLASTVPFDASAAEAQTVKAAAQQVLRVGPDQQYTRPSQAAQVARDGALLEVHSGQHEADVAVWCQNDLTLRGVGERPHLRAGGRAAEGKAIWVTKGIASPWRTCRCPVQGAPPGTAQPYAPREPT